MRLISEKTITRAVNAVIASFIAMGLVTSASIVSAIGSVDEEPTVTVIETDRQPTSDYALINELAFDKPTVDRLSAVSLPSAPISPVLPALIDTIEPTPPPVQLEPESTPVPEPPVIAFAMSDHYGADSISHPDGYSFTELTLPTAYYPNVNFSYFKAWMPYTVLGRNNQCGRIAYSSNAFTDDNGLRRYAVQPGEFSVDGQADYLVAMGTFYKPKGTVGQRYLIVTPSGSYTVRTSDELADVHSDRHHMFSWHGNYACVLEFLVDRKALARPAKQMGTVSALGGLLGENIQYIYRIN